MGNPWRFARRRRGLVAFLGVVSLLVAPARGAESTASAPEPGPGTLVVLKTPETTLKVGGRVVSDRGRFHHFVVEKVKGDWLWVVASGLGGWAKRDDVVPLDRALDYYNGVLQAQPDAAWAYNRRALLHQDRREFDAALADYAEALKRDPKNPSLYNNRAVLHAARGETDRALADYREALRLAPDDASLYHGRALIWSATRAYDQAIADSNEALKRQPKLAAAYVNRALAWEGKGVFERALADYGEAIRLDPDDPLVYNNRGAAWEAKGDHARALADYTEALQLDPKYAKAYVNRGRLRRLQGDCPQALADFDRALQLDSKNVRALAGRAWIWATCPDEQWRDGKKALDAATRACEVSRGRDPDSLGALAAALAETGAFDAAVKRQSEALTLLPDGPDKDAADARLALYRSHLTYRFGGPVHP